MSSTALRQVEHPIRRVAILFAGGPAPAANAVISAAADSFISNRVEVIGILHGYSSLVNYTPGEKLKKGDDYIDLNQRVLKRTRNSQGILIGTARENPGAFVRTKEDLQDEAKTLKLKNVYENLVALEVDALVSIGGDDTLSTANKLLNYQDSLPKDRKRIAVVHLPKTIDNDYYGIDFTFGYFTAVNTLAVELRNLIYDAEASGSYFIAETMGRNAGWLAYGAAIAGESSLVVSVEDVLDNVSDEERQVTRSTPDGGTETVTEVQKVMDIDALVKRIVNIMRFRKEKQGKEYGVIVLAEGLAAYMPLKDRDGNVREELKNVKLDPHGHIPLAQVNLARILSEEVARVYDSEMEQAHGPRKKPKKVTGIQLGYETRCAQPSAFDVMLGSQLGVGAYRSLCERKIHGAMVSVSGQLQLEYVPIEEIVNPETLKAKVRYIETGSDFYKLARFLETKILDWSPNQ